MLQRHHLSSRVAPGIGCGPCLTNITRAPGFAAHAQPQRRSAGVPAEGTGTRDHASPLAQGSLGHLS